MGILRLMHERRQGMEPSTRRWGAILSPLRYPGGKRRFARYVAEVIRLNSLQPKVFVEPFAGGASVSLRLLNDGVVEAVALGERDPLVASFWKVLFDDTDWLIEQIERIEVSVAKWRYFRDTSFHSHRERALACFFLNRTSFGGMLGKPTPIGGYAQESKYKIDDGFNVGALVKRIRQVAAFRERVRLVNHGDWRDTIKKVQSWGHKDEEVFYYLDPPFCETSAHVYRYHFEAADHEALRDRLMHLRQPWLLSYDPAPAIQELYANSGLVEDRTDILYTLSRTRNRAAQEMILTNLLNLPGRIGRQPLDIQKRTTTSM